MNAVTHLASPSPYQRLLELPENLVGEVLGGELYTQPRPRARHKDDDAVSVPPFDAVSFFLGDWWV